MWVTCTGRQQETARSGWAFWEPSQLQKARKSGPWQSRCECGASEDGLHTVIVRAHGAPQGHVVTAWLMHDRCLHLCGHMFTMWLMHSGCSTCVGGDGCYALLLSKPS